MNQGGLSRLMTMDAQGSKVSTEYFNMSNNSMNPKLNNKPLQKIP